MRRKATRQVMELVVTVATATALGCGGGSGNDGHGGSGTPGVGGVAGGTQAKGGSGGSVAAKGGNGGVGGELKGGSGGSGGAAAGSGGTVAQGGSGGVAGAAGGAVAGSGGAVAGSGGGAAGSGGAQAGSGGAGGADPLLAVLTPDELARVVTLGPLPALPADTTNQYADSAAAATLGQRLFFDKRYSGALAVADDGTNGGLGQVGDTGKISCASCHAGAGLDDRRSKPGNVSLGADYLNRNALPLVNSSFYKWTNWAGRFAAQWELPLAVTENAKNMNGDRMRVVHLIYDKYKADYEAIFGALDTGIADTTRFPASAKPKASGATDGPWEMMAAGDRDIATRVYVNFGKALAAYVRKLVSRNNKLDRFIARDVSALSAQEVRGLKLFVGSAGCVMCHSGPQLSDGLFHNIGVPQTSAHATGTDNGRFADGASEFSAAINVDSVWSDDRQTGRLADLSATLPDATKGQFRTPSLRGVADTAPYMHAGQLATLDDVLAFYLSGGGTPSAGTSELAGRPPIALDTNQRADLVAFLKTLSGDAVPAALLTDTSAP